MSAKLDMKDAHGKSRNGHGKGIEKSWNYSVQRLWEPCCLWDFTIPLRDTTGSPISAARQKKNMVLT